jgi:hypothetical protein
MSDTPKETSRIISWDVGIIHLAYCVLEMKILSESERPQIRIIDWDTINLVEDDRIVLNCSGHTKSNEICGKNAKYYMQLIDGTMIGFCNMHRDQCEEHFDENAILNMFQEVDDETCTYVQRNNKCCGKSAKFQENKLFLCNTHYKSQLQKKTKLYSIQPIKNLTIKKYPTAQLQLNLMVKLDSLAEHFAKLKITEVVIENQPSFKNPKMKSMANTLFDYFSIRGMIDHVWGLNIEMVKMMSPSNKLKLSNDNTLKVFKKAKSKSGSKTSKESKKYKLTKELGMQYTRQLLKDELDQLEYLALYKKKDDMCDAYLQGRYYLEIYREQNIASMKKNFVCPVIEKANVEKTKLKSKTKAMVITI